jgi:amidase
MTRSVADAAAVLTVIAGFDPLDNYTSAAPKPIPDYTKALKKTALKGKRIGVPRKLFLDKQATGLSQAELDAFEGALKTIKSLGATIVDNADLPSAMEIQSSNNETIVLNVDFKVRACVFVRWMKLVLMKYDMMDRTGCLLCWSGLQSVRCS